ncbi:MAG: ATP-binding cassette domain-containing protein, partial [Phreatobacter sp.]
MTLLTLNNVEVVYDRVFLAVKGVSIEVPERGLVALLGANGAGKSTILKSISGLLKPERGEVSRGEVAFAGDDIL